MYPILFRIPAFGEFEGFGVPSYSVLMALGYGFALWIFFKLTPKGPGPKGDKKSLAPNSVGPNRGQLWDLWIVMLVASLLGSKMGHVLFEAPGHTTEDGAPINSVWELLASDPLHWARLGEGGYVWYGGLIASLIAAVVYFKRRPHLQPWVYSDVAAPAIMGGAAVGRMGCFLAGCCYGVPTDVPWGMYIHGDIVHPTQIYDTLIAATLFGVLFWRYKNRKFDGECIALLLITYPVLRSLTEVFRGDPERGSFGPLSTSQWLSIPLFIIGVYFYVSRKKKAESTAEEAPRDEALEPPSAPG